MKKKLVSLFVFITTCISAQNNVFFSADFWKSKPSVEQVKQKIAEGNDPVALNERAYDATSLAINNGASFETIVYLLSLKGNEVDKLTHDKRTYIFWAAFQNRLDVAKYLLDKGAKTDVRDSHLYSPLLFSAVRGNKSLEMYELLIKYGANVKDRNENGATALLLLIPHLKDLKEVDYFIKKGLSLKDVDNKGDNSIFYAARYGNQDIINQLIKKKIDVKAVNKKGQNIAFVAAEGGRGKSNDISFFKYVESLGINPNQKDKEGLTPLFILSFRHRDVGVLSYFIEKGNDVNQTNASGQSPLMNAASSNVLPIVTLLADKTQNINAVNNHKQSALTLAVHRNSAEVVDFLIGKGADVNVKDDKGNSLVYYLVDGYSPRNQEDFNKKWDILLEKGLDMAQLQANGNTIYHLAVQKGNLDLLQKASSASVSVDTKNEEGLTPLHQAIMTAKNLDIINFLLEKGADKTVTTDFGESAYDLAQENEALNGLNINFLK